MQWNSLKLVRQLEWLAQRTPTWVAVLISVICLTAIALWIQDDFVIHSPLDLFSKEALRIIFEHAESFAIVAAVILYFKSAPDRKAQKHYEAWRIIDNAAAAKVFTSYARFQALQDLHQDSVPLRALEASGANLTQIRLPKADLMEANLKGADLREACLIQANLSKAQLQGANLQKANLKGVNFHGANLEGANLRDADLTGADLQAANLKGANLRGAELWKAQFLGADLEEADLRWAEFQGGELNGARLKHTTMPDGSMEMQDIEYWGSHL
jgi:BTB/POZ domain-containing protein KCTD9